MVEPVIANEQHLPSPILLPRPREDTEHGFLLSLQSLLATVVIAVFVITFVVQAFQIPSESMENTLLIGDYLLVNKLRYGGAALGNLLIPYQKVRRGDIVVFHYPINPAQHFVKRVIGVPGDHIRLIDRQVWVNGLPLKEPYARYSSSAHDIYRDDFPQVDYIVQGEEGRWFEELKKDVQHGELIVPLGEYFVMGDNRDESLDSRYWGFVPRQNIIGSPLVIYWSINNRDGGYSGADTASDKIMHFTYALTHLFKITRWERTFRLVN
ncbi:MAG: signal peptidase I [Acidobacteria bacterium]|nr:signal peptidase I [Acidobacteriota bacterium]MBV8893255.1 signal peptidase I [Acidobacteriota bacterium]MBV9481575.1 signal peptidase I [Acidobacteriota bacterium]